MAKRQIYLDNSATTPICEEALEGYIEASRAHYGNPSSLHSVGVDAEREMDRARATILRSLYADKGEIIFTSGGTEANLLAIIGRVRSKARYRTGVRIVTSMGEHASVEAAMVALEKEGHTVKRISTAGGSLDLDELEAALTKDTVLVSVMLVNNETGAVYDIPKVAALVRRLAPEAYLHVDATQGYMKIPFSPMGLGADMITVSSHKIHGPKGVGALYVSPRVITERGISAQMLGGGQELGLRSGTENVPAIVGFGRAAEVGMARIADDAAHMSGLKARLIKIIKTSPELCEIGVVEPPMHAPHIINLTLPSIKSETMLHYLSSEGIFVSSGSACSSNTSHKSAALIAYGKSEREADTSIRVSLSHNNTKEDIDALTDALAAGLKRLARIGK
ncbi:MAG: cysteine desulfurase [Clostridia bacterium]|nr:cysteine desulfurase [Clostridia bacterium]